ncbi:MAG: DNA recombination protein RmuC [Candidatus Heimdallarchaeota archaeon]
MTNVGIYILLSLILTAGIAIFISIWYIQKNKQPDIDQLNEEILRVSTNMSNEVQKLFHTLQMKPTATGALGENIADIILSSIPKAYVKSQYKPKDISGSKIDFVVKLPNSDLCIPIDCKFTIPEDFEIDKLDKKKEKELNSFAVARAKTIVKYISSKETTDFVLMFIPDFVYFVIDQDTFQELNNMCVVPVNSGSLLSIIFLIKMQHRFYELNNSANKFAGAQIKSLQGLKKVQSIMQKSFTQLQHCQKNLSDALSEIVMIKNALETLDTEEVIE